MNEFLRAGEPFNYDTNVAGNESGLDCSVDGEGRTRQSFKAEVDINTIVARFGLTGQLPINVRIPLNVDFEGIADFQSAMNRVIEAREAFAALPANIRSRFHNNPAELVDFVSVEENRAEAEKLGLVVPKPVVEPSAVVVAAVKPPAQ